MSEFPVLTGDPTFYRTYSKKIGGVRENWGDVCDRTLHGLKKLGKLTDEEAELIDEMQRSLKTLSSGRWLWVGGTEWGEKPENFSGSYNCSSTEIVDWESFGLLMDLAMQGCGTGAVLEDRCISQLPVIRNKLNILVGGEIGSIPKGDRREETLVINNPILSAVDIIVGDSRSGWVKSYQTILELSSCDYLDNEINIAIDLSNVRPSGEKLKGFGGTANPVKLADLYGKVADILNGAIGRKLNSVECCLLIDEAALVVVAGNLRRSAGMRQADSDDEIFAVAKDNLWQQTESGEWRIDPKRDALRMANHTRVFHRKPTLEECIESVRKQYRSGEGAIQWAGEAVARANADLLDTPELKKRFIEAYQKDDDLLGGKGKFFLGKYEIEKQYSVKNNGELISPRELDHRMSRYGLNPLTLAA